MAFIIQEQKESVSASGIILKNQNDRKASHGTVYSVNTEVVCPHCTEKFNRKDLAAGDRVLFSRYVAEQIEVDTEDLKGKVVWSVPVDAILAKIT